METITDNLPLAVMFLAVGIFLICCGAIGLVIRCNWRNRTNYSKDMIDSYDEIHDKRKLD
jgi:hypothetical protein